ncbi:MAG: cytochrome d ubiquinol oxidase subunit II [Chryseolinea sp.]
MSTIVTAYLCLSVLLYFLLGGADFGAGIIEMFTSKKNVTRTRKTLYQAIGPIWEANHMWLIIAIVILFVGFPSIYSLLSIHLHIPLVILLMGIIARGTAFVFRHYDAIKDGMQDVYNKIFVVSSVITPLFLGILAGSTLAGHIDPHADNFFDAYIYPWFNLFSISIGLFTVALCGFLAAVYLIGEADNEHDRKRFVTKAKISNLLAVGFGLLVFASAQIEKVPLTDWLFRNAVGCTAVMTASASLVLLWQWINKKRPAVLRVLVAFQVTMILLAITFAHFPNVILLPDGQAISLSESEAPEKTMDSLGWALITGSLFILPALYYLFYSFQKSEDYAH